MKILQFSIPRLHERQTLHREKLIEKGVPAENIEVWNGPDGQDYAKTYQIFEAMIDDGFPHAKNFLRANYDHWLGNALAAQHWSYCRLFRHIRDTGETCVCLHDDRMLNEGYYTDLIGVSEHVQAVAQKAGVPFKFMALEYFPPFSQDEPFIEITYADPEQRVINGIVRLAADVGFILTPAGGEWLLENYTYIDVHPNLEIAFKMFMREWKTITEPFQWTGVYTANREKFIATIPADSSKSTIFANDDDDIGTKYVLPISQTRR